MFKKFLITSFIALFASSAFAKNVDFLTQLNAEVDILKVSSEEADLKMKMQEAAIVFGKHTLYKIIEMSPDEIAIIKRSANKYKSYKFMAAVYDFYRDHNESKFVNIMKSLCTPRFSMKEACIYVK